MREDVEVTKVTVKDALLMDDVIFIDTRTPKEYAECHVPKAHNVPILSNEERHIVGFLYKQVSVEKAYDVGFEIYEKKKNEIVSKVKELLKSKGAKKVIVYCARGGMRSRVVAQLLVSSGFNSLQMEGGHKKYREYVREKLGTYKFMPKLIVLYGLTGSGKSELLQKMDMPKIDLEEIAQHRSSLLGAVGLNPRTQKFFESVLFYVLNKVNSEKCVFIEGESRKVGDRVVPEFLFKAMKENCVNVRVKCSLKERVKRIVPEYFDTPKKVKEVYDVTEKMRQLLSNKVVDMLLKMLKNKKYEEYTEYMLINYYDGKYGFTVDNVKYDFEICNDSVIDGLIELKKIYENVCNENN